jgi:hypothetical protein
MKAPIEKPDVPGVLRALKNFQQRSVDYVFRRMYEDNLPARRFLVADEVGLGKTLVARGVIAKVVNHLWDQRNITVVYICSNADIARQNIDRLNIAESCAFVEPSRITLLPTMKRNQKKLAFIALTPGTSFELKSNPGKAEERVLLYWLLHKRWRFRGERPKNVLTVRVSKRRFARDLRKFAGTSPIDRSLRRSFFDALQDDNRERRSEGKPTLYVRFKRLCRELPHARRWGNIPQATRQEICEVIGELRAILAETCVRSLDPDLIILDEFQRFRHLLEAEDDAGLLAAKLFQWEDARVLLLSATPYKMYTSGDEQGGEDHYRDFLRTIGFLLHDSEREARLGVLLKDYRRHLYRLAEGDVAGLTQTRKELETLLRSVMIRNERLAASKDRNGMLREVTHNVGLETCDVRAYLQLQRIIQWLEDDDGDGLALGDQIEFWKSAPYLLNFMEHYQLKRVFSEVTESVRQGSRRGQELASRIGDAEDTLLSWNAIDSYNAIDPGNPRLRGLFKDVLAFADAKAWQLLWVPPTAPYYRLSGPFATAGLNGFTKRLIFSSWKVVPKAISVLLSYEAERQMMKSFDPAARNSTASRENRGRLLDFSRSQGRLTGMPVLALIYPCGFLAERFDPLRIGYSGHTVGTLYDGPDVLERVEQEMQLHMQEITTGAPSAGQFDERWYWAAPLLFDQRHNLDVVSEWFQREDVADYWRGKTDSGSEEAGQSAWMQHVQEARDLLDNPRTLGRPPADLSRVMAQMAIAGPGVTALRSLARVCGGVTAMSDLGVRDFAGSIGWGFRSLFNLPEVTSMIRGMNGAEPYWRRMLEYCVDGCLQAVLDEYVHMLHEPLRLAYMDQAKKAGKLAEAIVQSVALHVAQPRVDKVSRNREGVVAVDDQRIMRARFAMRFGDDGGEEESSRARKEHVRGAFNSPFWPFVLASTSVGQEGLDFHQYCHAVVHWNLPANPVDLEQREGRVHRYKGHAIRKNVAERYRDALSGAWCDPWEAMFELAREKSQDAAQIVPYWVCEGSAMIERHIPMLPLSRDARALPGLKAALAVYRMVFGQPRQDDLLEYLTQRLTPEQLAAALDSVRIDLTPIGNQRGHVESVV